MTVLSIMQRDGMTATEVKTQEQIEMERFLRVRGWSFDSSEQMYTSPDGQWTVLLLDDAVELAPSDEGRTFIARSIDALREELYGVGAIEWECPNCGEEGGSPVTVAWDEYQGVSPHGGTVTFTEEFCMKCARRS